MNDFLTYIEKQPMAIILLFGLVLLVYVMFKIQRSKNNVDLYYLILDEKTQQPSLHKLGQLVALAVSTWALIYESLQGHLSEWLFGSYMIAWAAAEATNRFLSKGDDDRQLPPQ